MRSAQSDAPESDPTYRERLLKECGGEWDSELLWQRLLRIDPSSAEKIHKNNVKRVIRALEIYDTTGVTKTELDERSRMASSDISVGMITLDFHDRELLYSRIDRRVDIMLRDGLAEEVWSLYSRGLLPEGSTAAQAIGYKEMLRYVDGRCTLDEAADEIRLASRRYAKRQLTWFRHNRDACRVFADTETGIMREPTELSDEVYACAVGIMSGWRDEKMKYRKE